MSVITPIDKGMFLENFHEKIEKFYEFTDIIASCHEYVVDLQAPIKIFEACVPKDLEKHAVWKDRSLEQTSQQYARKMGLGSRKPEVNEKILLAHIVHCYRLAVSVIVFACDKDPTLPSTQAKILEEMKKNVTHMVLQEDRSTTVGQVAKKVEGVMSWALRKSIAMKGRVPKEGDSVALWQAEKGIGNVMSWALRTPITMEGQIKREIDVFCEKICPVLERELAIETYHP